MFFWQTRRGLPWLFVMLVYNKKGCLNVLLWNFNAGLFLFFVWSAYRDLSSRDPNKVRRRPKHAKTRYRTLPPQKKGRYSNWNMDPKRAQCLHIHMLFFVIWWYIRFWLLYPLREKATSCQSSAIAIVFCCLVTLCKDGPKTTTRKLCPHWFL